MRRDNNPIRILNIKEKREYYYGRKLGQLGE